MVTKLAMKKNFKILFIVKKTLSINTYFSKLKYIFIKKLGENLSKSKDLFLAEKNLLIKSW